MKKKHTYIKKQPNDLVFHTQYASGGAILISRDTLYGFTSLSAGEKLAYDYLVSDYDSKTSVAVSNYQHREGVLREEVKHWDKKLLEAEEELKAFLASPNLPDLEKPSMPTWMKLTQVGLFAGMIGLTGLGTQAYVTLLETHEQFAGKTLKAVSYCLSGNLVAVLGMKSMLTLIPHAKAQLVIAIATCSIGLAATGFGLVGNGVLFAPESQKDQIAIINETLDVKLPDAGDPAGDPFAVAGDWTTDDVVPDKSVDTAVTGASDGVGISVEGKKVESSQTEEASFFDEDPGQKVMISQVAGECCVASVLGFFFTRNLKNHRTTPLYRRPEYKELKAKVDELRAKKDAAEKELGEVRGHLKAIKTGRVSFVGEGMAYFYALRG